MKSSIKGLILLLGCVFLFGAAVSGEPKVTTIKLPNGGVRPKAVIDSKGTVHIVYSDAKKTSELYYVKQEAGKKGFSKPIKVLHDASAMAASFNMSVGKNGRVHVITRPTPKYSKKVMGAEYQKVWKQNKFYVLQFMLHSRLNDKGTAFEKEQNIAGNTKAFEGVGAVVGDENSNKVYIFWNANVEIGPEMDRDMYKAVSEDEGKTWSDPIKLNVDIDGACRCCSIEAAMDADNNMYLVYRNSVKTGQRSWDRDTYLLTSKDQGQTWNKQLAHKWVKCGCPGAPPSIATGQHGVYFGFRTKGVSYFCKVDEQLSPIAAPSTGKMSMKPMLATNKDGDVIFTWAEAQNIAWQVYDKNNKPIANAKGLLKNVSSRWSNAAVVAKDDGEFLLYYDGSTTGRLIGGPGDG